MSKTQAGQMRLQRESRMSKKEIETQIQKSGKLQDNFICLPDPEDAYVWYYVVFDLDHPDFQGGYYLGKIICPNDYPAKAPKITLITDNGRFHNWNEGICLSISDYHPESWNPVWKVTQIVIGLVSFWVQEKEYTYGAVEQCEVTLDEGETFSDRRIKLAKESRKKVLEHEKFKSIFSQYADAIGINKDYSDNERWVQHDAKMAELNQKKEEKRIEAERQAEIKRLAEQKRLEEERIKKEEEERRIQEELRIKQEEEEKKRMANIHNLFFLKIREMGLTECIGRPQKLQKLKNKNVQ